VIDETTARAADLWRRFAEASDSAEASDLLQDTLIQDGTMARLQAKAVSHSVPLFTEEGPASRQWGSATLVAGNGQHYLLTAAHVWQLLSRSKRFATVVEDGTTAWFLGTKDVHVRSIPELQAMPLERDGWSSDGPDLALISLPPGCVTQLSRVKTFYNLDEQDQHAPDAAGTGLWGVLGSPAELSDIGPKEAAIFVGFYTSFVVHKSEKGDLDYIDMKYDRADNQSLPKHYGGVSGGGLWHAALRLDVSAWVLSLEGVAFNQIVDPVSTTRGAIRCHGRRTIDLLVNRRPSRLPKEAAT
jgi:hypothetical protein